MSARELIVLGTASQVPTRERNQSAYFLRWDDQGFLIDPGEGAQRQMAIVGVSASAITRILITHFHGDHCLGLSGIIQRISLDGVPREIPIHFPASGERYISHLRHASIFHDRARLAPTPIVEAGVIHRSDDLTITALPLDHGVDCYGYRIEEPERSNLDPTRLEAEGIHGPLAGELKRSGRVEVSGKVVRLEDVSTARKGQVFAVILDTRTCESAIELARDADVLLCESTFLESEAAEAEAYGHLTARAAGEIARAAGARTLVLTHFSQRYREVERFAEEASKVHPNVIAATDGLIVPFPPRRDGG
ncbi:MAG TPA: ribonuclease Z [Planctomycetota bacterium]|nr:ribonuclease Z [Planctomycetota bacterium]